MKVRKTIKYWTRKSITSKGRNQGKEKNELGVKKINQHAKEITEEKHQKRSEAKGGTKE